MKRFDAVALGELLVDFTKENNGAGFKANPGGAPCNVLAMLSGLGRSTAFIGKVGDDMFGHFLKEETERAGINTDFLYFDKAAKTTLAFVNNLPDAEREFAFYRRNTADTELLESEVPETLIADSRLFHFGTLSLTDEPSAQATRRAVSLAKKHGLLISFDPNLRPALWKNMSEAKNAFLYGVSKCNILKISDEEVKAYLDTEDLKKAAEKLLEEYGQLKTVFVTAGKDGSYAFTRETAVYKESYKVNSVDATGAGDCFMGTVLDCILETGNAEPPAEKIERMLEIANAAAAIVTTRRGAMNSMPKRDEIRRLLGE